MNDIDQDKAPMTPEEQKVYQARQKHRAIIMAGLLLSMVVLFYFITIVKIGSGS
ncbi:hypothetical protein [uncultured Parasphingorhabdus sp.]|uniref:hypothetical protein n=1 Tax=uncultured Parasphingorhabdus sp. TaxID=2709694 RepID=UPI0030DA5CB8|tara:strand:+ start:5194 stop:5355 length:162 start_codon:yes stop_codon:yes gene_type:complete